MNLEEIFCLVDDFCQAFIPLWEKMLLADGKRQRKRSGNLSESEFLTIYLLFQTSGYRDFKHYYHREVLQGHLRKAFPKALSYTRFIARLPRMFVPLCAFLQSLCVPFDGLGFIDLTSFAVCHNKRTSSHAIFRDFAKLGKTTKGWFYGFKLHLISNSQGQLCACKLTPGNCDDRKPVEQMTRDMIGKLFADKGYIDQKPNQTLLDRGLQLITGIRKRMKNKLMPLMDKILLRKRGLIESTNNLLKNVFHLEHTRHRNPINGFANMIASCIAYALHPNKPALKLNDNERYALIAA
ncbi:membrane-associated, metal-dependent hydrolase [Legionella busanensis]|uniref:Membrane-associated, metal-dependent hydrolase n=1 Tax=Legionella busanensis TaxID=190655 RepID=A0A378K9W9_9GAMM|nr:IS982 family transposase [Legionella busanensis]STX81507.1 membrane-associated, metal-dependent hydrolase [Legionella busanensis]